MHLGEGIRRVKQIRDCHAALRVGRGDPDAHVHGLGDVVAACADVERAADAGLEGGEGGGLVPAPAVAALAGLGV